MKMQPEVRPAGCMPLLSVVVVLSIHHCHVGHAQTKPLRSSSAQKPQTARSIWSHALESVSLLHQEIELKKIEVKQKESESGRKNIREREWNYAEAQLYWLKQRAYPNDTIDWRAYTSAFATKLKMAAMRLLLPPGVAGQAPRWENIGPLNLPVPYRRYYGEGQTSGRVNAVAYDPAHPLTMFLGSAGGGLWRTTDGGKTWMPKGDSWDNTKVSSVSVSADGHIVYIGTGDFDGGKSAYGFGLKKSSNGGDNWTGMLKSELKGYSTHRIIIDPDNSNIVLVTAGNNPFGPGKLFRTEDGGATSWRALEQISSAPHFAVPIHFHRELSQGSLGRLSPLIDRWASSKERHRRRFMERHHCQSAGRIQPVTR